MNFNTITVGLPVYNMAATVGEAIESVLRQTCSDWILSISDNASTDGTFEICKQYEERDSRIHVSRNTTNIGAMKNFEKLLKLSQTRFYAALAADDYFEPSYLEECRSKLIATPGALHCCSEINFIDEHRTIIGHHPNINTVGKSLPEKIRILLEKTGWFAFYGVTYTEVLKKIPSRSFYGTDVLFLLDLLILGDITLVNKPLFNYYLVTDKPASQYAEDLTGCISKIDRKPYTNMLKNLYHILESCKAPNDIKELSKKELIYTIAHKNQDYLQRVINEAISIVPDRLSTYGLRQGFVSSLVNGLKTESRLALVFFPHNPWPAKSGAHSRVLEMMRGLIRLGYQVVLFSTTTFTDSPWTQNRAEELIKETGIHIELYCGSDEDKRYLANLSPDQFWERFLPPGLILQFRNTFQKLKAELVIINYSMWGGLCNDEMFKDTNLVMDALDLFTKNVKMTNKVRSLSIDYNDGTYDIDSKALREDFFDLALDADGSEMQIFDIFDTTIAVSEAEAHAIKSHQAKTRVETVPLSCQTVNNNNTHEDYPIFVVGPNYFNSQGYYYLCRNILPIVRRYMPDHLTRIVGSGTSVLRPERGIILQGFVENLDVLYSRAAYALCPLIGGTGQQVKVVEAMAHGLPVIILKNVAASSPIRHGINGLIANNAAEFANYMIELSKNRDLCKVLGQQARATIQDLYSEIAFTKRLAGIIESC